MSATKPKRVDRWSAGIPHDPRSIEIYEAIAKIDFEEFSDSFCFKSGGDGDNGETLMYLLDAYFEDKDAAQAKSDPDTKDVVRADYAGDGSKSAGHDYSKWRERLGALAEGDIFAVTQTTSWFKDGAVYAVNLCLRSMDAELIIWSEFVGISSIYPFESARRDQEYVARECWVRACR